MKQYPKYPEWERDKGWFWTQIGQHRVSMRRISGLTQVEVVINSEGSDYLKYRIFRETELAKMQEDLLIYLALETL